MDILWTTCSLYDYNVVIYALYALFVVVVEYKFYHLLFYIMVLWGTSCETLWHHARWAPHYHMSAIGCKKSVA